MSERRKHRLVDCNPHFVRGGNGSLCAVYFECPEGHDDCKHVIPFTPALDGSPGQWHGKGASGVTWQRSGGTFEIISDEGKIFESLTLSPSIRRIQRHVDRDAAIAAGCLPEYITETLFCALHIFIKDGAIEFCGDSK